MIEHVATSDQIVLTVWHWVIGALGSGGVLAAIVSYILSQRKKKKISVAVDAAWDKALEDHKSDDTNKFIAINNHLEKQYDIMVSMSTDIGKIKGKLGIQ